MSFKNRNVRFWGLVALPAMLLSGYIVGCSKAQINMPGAVSGAVRDDFEKDGYEVTDPPLSPNEALRQSMRLLYADGRVALGPISRTDEGFYVFIAPPGDYKVEASCPGFEPHTKSVTITNGGSATKNFGLIKVDPNP